LAETPQNLSTTANGGMSPELHRRGTLILVVGPSGAGKDTLIEAARQHFRGDARVQFPLRVITRGGQAGERHIALSERDFLECEKQGCFCLSWRAHGLFYGVPAETLDVLTAGGSIVVNVSRGMITKARAMWLHTRVAHVTASPQVLWSRLIARGRETGLQAMERLCRAEAAHGGVPDAPWVDEIDNSGDLAAAAKRFTGLIAKYAAPPHS
jgi:ribose 1,5-bisphosphokinase